MKEGICVSGIRTNNLKNIDVDIVKNAVNLIVGPSGSGKSSLAYDTIAQIGLYEFNSIFSDTPFESNFVVRSYSNIVATAPIHQNNNNNNVRSTIGTYFNINSHIALIYSALVDLPYDFFVLNKEENNCSKCHGIGYIRQLDINKIVDYNVSLENCPIKCWIRHKDFYVNMISSFCADVGLDQKKSFKELSKTERTLFLYGESKNKYSIRFKKNNSYSRRTTNYFGIMTGKPMLPKFTPSSKFFSDMVCPDCGGQKYSCQHNKIKVHGLSIGELMCTPFSDICTWVSLVEKSIHDLNLDFSLQRIANFSSTAASLNLGHLYFNRSIPSLSGGELQRVKLVQVFNTQLTDLLIILDEPLAGMSAVEKETVCSRIEGLSHDHTLLIIDHHNLFYKSAINIIALGKGSGKYGGSLVDSENYIKSQHFDYKFTPKKIEKYYTIDIENNVYSYRGAKITLAKDRLNLLTGYSGVGKSTLLREYLPQHFDRYTYINQKPLVGNTNSNVATSLNIFNNLINIFAKKFNKDKHYFSNHTGCDGTCTSCLGTGKIFYGNDYQDGIHLECKKCEGTGFNNKLKLFKIDGFSMLDIWKLTIDEFFSFMIYDDKISKVLFQAREIQLGHLLIGQPTSNLSGGENLRIKVLKSLTKTSHIYGIDEPFRGLNNTEIYNLVVFFENFLDGNKTLIIADHEEESFKYFSHHIELKNFEGYLVGV